MNTLINGAILVGILLAICIPLALFAERKRKRKIEAAFAGRESLAEQTFYEKYFQSQGVPFFIVMNVRHILEDELDADLSRLSAEDDFTRNLSFFFDYDSWANIEIVVKLEKEFQITITNAEAQATHTVEDIIHLVWAKLRQREA
jgi:acyl carrier protein